jgi:dihydroneopterin aldolase
VFLKFLDFDKISIFRKKIMGIIEIEGMEFYAYHGCFSEERIVGNRFMIDLRMETDTSKPELTDNIHDAVNYQTAYQIAKKQMDSKAHLLEHVAYRILKQLFQDLPTVVHARIKVAKINPPLGGKVEQVSVTLEKLKTDFQ